MGFRFHKIGLLSHVWGGNLGDDGSLDAVIDGIRERWSDVELVGLTMNPEDTRERHGISAVPIRARGWGRKARPVAERSTLRQGVKSALREHAALSKALKAAYRVAVRLPRSIWRELLLFGRTLGVIRSLDCLIISGGGQLIESSGGAWRFVGGPWQFPYTVFKWICAARLFGAKCVVLNVGAGPLFRPLTKFFVRSSLSLADYVSFRDADSQALVRGLGFKGVTHVCPDNAYSLDVSSYQAAAPADRRRINVGFAPMAYADRRLSMENEPGIYERFVRQLGVYGTWLLGQGYQVTFFCTDIGVDPPVIEDVRRILESRSAMDSEREGGATGRVHQWTTGELLTNMASMDYVVVCRYHAVVFAHLLNIPVLAISHHPKVKTLMNALGLGEFCVDICDTDEKEFSERFASLVENREAVKSRMAERLADYRRQLTVQFDGLFPPGKQRHEVADESKKSGFLPVSK